MTVDEKGIIIRFPIRLVTLIKVVVQRIVAVQRISTSSSRKS